MRFRHNRADILDMETGRGRFRRADQADEARRDLRADVLALRNELELLDEVLRPGGARRSGRTPLDPSFAALRAAEHAWLDARVPDDLLAVVTQLEAARAALEATLAVRAGRAGDAG
jgi:hypothetical protein